MPAHLMRMYDFIKNSYVNTDNLQLQDQLRSSTDTYDGHYKQRLAGRTLNREGRSACLDRRRELGAVCLADGDDWDRDAWVCATRLAGSSVLVVVDDNRDRASGLHIHCLLDKGTVATLEQHELSGGVRVRQLGRAVQRIG